MKKFCFTVDDNIRFLRELTDSDAVSLFDHPYTALLRQLHEQYGLKVQLNLFYQTAGFDLSRMSDRFRAEWAENASWLRLSFHSRMENENPYLNAGYDEVYADCASVQAEILRFAGRENLGRTTTIHYCQVTPEGLQALRDLGVQGLLGLYGRDDAPGSSYSLAAEDCARLRKGEILHRNGLAFHALELVMNNYDQDGLLRKLQQLSCRDRLHVMIHEQYFYPDYPAYQPDFAEKLDAAFRFLQDSGYESCFAEAL